jgi:hypothetical protein
MDYHPFLESEQKTRSIRNEIEARATHGQNNFIIVNASLFVIQMQSHRITKISKRCPI